MLYRLVRTYVVLLLLTAPVMAGEVPPQWLRQAAATAGAASSREAPALVLLNESVIAVSEDGRLKTTRRYGVRILKSEGREEAVARAMYETASGKVREMRAWLIRSSGEVRSYGKDRTLDVAAVEDDVYNEARVRVIVASDEADVGSVFGYEMTSEERTIFTQFEWLFQNRLPVLLSRRVLTLPDGWRAESFTFNHPRVEPVVTGSTYAWELRNLPFIEAEPASPQVANLVPRVAVSLFPPSDKSGSLPSFDNWAAVSRFLSSLNDPQSHYNEAMAARARELTASARTELERIQAIARYVQSVHYISIQTGLGRGGGYRPHAATEVFARSYGDCKDKVNLMRAMLRSLSITSYPVAIYSGDPTYVREEWPSPQQFNHCVIAVQVSEQTQALTVIRHPTLGRLLLFDPTDPDTAVGDLPEHEQGSFALLAAGEAGLLVRTPRIPPAANRIERRIEVTLEADGSVKATLNEQATGQAGARLRGEYRDLARPEYARMLEDGIARGVQGARVTKYDAADNSPEARFTLTVEFSAPRYAQLMGGHLLLFKPAMVARYETLVLTAAARKYPVVLRSESCDEVVRIKLPTGFVVDELPPPVKLDAGFGVYSAACEVEDGFLVFRRSFQFETGVIPAEQYNAVRSFFERIRSAEQTPVVLARGQ